MVEPIVESSTEAVLNVARTERIRALHVDDDQAFLKVAKQCLEMQGEIDVDTVSSVNEASEKLKKTDYDAVVCDFQMPGKDGIEFLKELRANGNNIPFIVFTGKGREEIAIKALNLGADRYVDKHGDPETVYCELAHAIRQATDRKSKEIELFKKEAKLQAVLESSPDAITVSDLKGNVIQCNKATLDMLGFSSKDELIGKNGYELIAEKDHQKATENLKKTLDQGSVRNIEYTFLTRDGHEFPTELSASVLRDSSGKAVGFVSVAKNISERKKAEEKLRKSSEEWKRTFDAISDIVFILDTNFRFVRVNKALCNTLKKEPRELIGKHCYEVLHGIDRPWPNCPYKKTLSTGQAATEEVNDPHLGCWLLIANSPIFDDSGKLIGAVHSAKNITESKHAEEVLRLAEEKFRTIVESIQDVVMLTLPNGIISYLSPACSQVFGYQPEELVGKRPWISHPDDLEKLKAAHFDALKGKKGSDFEYRIITKTGQTRWISHSWSPIITNGQVKLIASAVVDITERKKMDEELKSSEQKFRGLVEGSAAAIATIDLKGRLTYVNRALADSLGYSVQEMSGRAFKDFVHPDDRGNLVRLFLKIIVLRRQPRKFEFRALRKDGAILHLMCKPTRLETAGKTVGFQAIIIDNTAEKRMLEKTQKLNEKLSVVGRLTRHDVNNKLSTILNVSYLLKQRLPDNQSLELVKETESAVHQIEGLFEFARTYEKLGTEELASVDVEKVFNEAAMLFPSLQDIKIVNDCHGLTVLADSLLSQLFHNLISNSLKHGEKVSQVRVHCQTREDHLKLIYEDDGIGIPKAEKDKIFKESHGKGGGHGLYLIKKMTEVYGWTISETGTQGKGARFIMTVPDQRAH